MYACCVEKLNFYLSLIQKVFGPLYLTLYVRIENNHLKFGNCVKFHSKINNFRIFGIRLARIHSSELQIIIKLLQQHMVWYFGIRNFWIILESKSKRDFLDTFYPGPPDNVLLFWFYLLNIFLYLSIYFTSLE